MIRPLLATLLLSPTLCGAQTPTPATLQLGGTKIPLPFALALQRDNAEGLLDEPKELRILFTDKQVDPALLQGLTPTFDLAPRAEAGELKGMLLRLDHATVLLP